MEAVKTHSYKNQQSVFREVFAMKINKENNQWLRRYTKKHIWAMIAIIAISSLSALLAVGLALATKIIVDYAVAGDMAKIVLPFVITALVIVFIAVANVVTKNAVAKLYGKIRNEITLDLQNKIFKKDYTKITSIHSGELVNIETSDIDIIVNGYIGIWISLFTILIKIVFGIVFIAVISWKLFLLCAGLCILLGVLSVLMRSKYKTLNKSMQKANGKLKAVLQENFQSVEIIKTYKISDYVAGLLADKMSDFNRQLVRINTLISTINNVIYTVFNIGYYCLIVVAVILLGTGGVSAFEFGSFTAITQLLIILKDPFLSATALVPQYFTIQASIERIRDIEALPDEICKESVSETLDFDKIIIKNLSFAYNEKYILENVNCEIERGDILAVIGESGAGKSTFIKLLLGLLTPSNGEICVCSGDKEYKFQSMPVGAVSYVPQTNFMSSGTIEANLTFGKSFTFEEIQNACQTACIYDTIIAMENGFQTIVGENGVGLSLGQNQRLAIARAILFGKEIIILDECTSALDDATEQNLLDNLKKLNKTIIAVSHKQNLIDFCNKKFIVKNGGINEIK